MKRPIVVLICVAALLANAGVASAAEHNVQKVCIITTGSSGEIWQFVPVPNWATGDLCEEMRKALPAGRGRNTKRGCMVGPGEPDFASNTFHIIGTNTGNPCHWPDVLN